MRTIGAQLALAGTITAQLDLTGDARHRHIPGSPYEWRHGWIPLTRAAALRHFHGHVPSSWHPASEAGRLSAPAHGRAEETVKAAGKGVEVAKVGKSWHLKENGQSLESFSSRKAAQAKMDGMVAQRARFAQVDAEKERRIGEITAKRGIAPVDYRDLKPGDQFATSPGGDLRTVTRAQHFDSGGSLVDWEANGHKDQTLFGTAGRQIYGRLSAPGKREETVKAGRMSEPSAGKTAATAGKTAAAAGKAPDLSAGLPPVPPDPGRYTGSDWNLKGMTGYLEAGDRRNALHSANRAAELQRNGGSHQDIMQALAAAEERAPASDRAFHAARLDAYANAYGLKGWYRYESSAGGQHHAVNVAKIRTAAEGDKGRYYASSNVLGSETHIVDRDTGRIVDRISGTDKAKAGKAAAARIAELEAPSAAPARETAPEHAAVSAAAKTGGKKARKKAARTEPAPAAQAAAPSVPAAEPVPVKDWSQLRRVNAADLKPGDQVFNPSMGSQMFVNKDGTVRGASGWTGPEGSSWMVTARSGNSVTGRLADGREVTQEIPQGKQVYKIASAPPAPAPAPTISEQLAMFGERTTSGKDVTSGDEGTLAPGDWHAGYQAIGAAPLDSIPSERSRQVDHPGSEYGVNVKGAWSDPVWVAKPGGGFAISARWKSKAQKVSVYGGGPARTVDHPAHDERVIIPVDAQGRTAKQSAEQELKAEQARQAKAAADKAEAARKADAARAERQAAAQQKSIERNNRLVAEQRARNEQEAARKAAGAQTARDRGLTEGARVFVDSGKFKGGIATVRSVGPDGRTMIEQKGLGLETLAPDQLRTQPGTAEEARRMQAVLDVEKSAKEFEAQQQRETEAAQRNSRGMDRMFARGGAQRQHMAEALGMQMPQEGQFGLGMGSSSFRQAESHILAGRYDQGIASINEALAAERAAPGRMSKAQAGRLAKLEKFRDQVSAAAANPKPTLPALARVHGTNRKGSFTALDHSGNEYKIGLDPSTKQVSVTRDGKTLTAPAGDDPTTVARQLAGQLASGPAFGTIGQQLAAVSARP